MDEPLCATNWCKWVFNSLSLEPNSPSIQLLYILLHSIPDHGYPRSDLSVGLTPRIVRVRLVHTLPEYETAENAKATASSVDRTPAKIFMMPVYTREYVSYRRDVAGIRKVLGKDLRGKN